MTLICASKNVIASEKFYNINLLISCNSVLSDLIIKLIKLFLESGFIF